MRNHVRNRSERTQASFEEGDEREPLLASLADIDEDPGAEEVFEDELADVERLSCPDCGQPIAVLADQEHLPEHALCATRWNPFGLTVCPGSGRAVDEARPLEDAEAEQDQEIAVVLVLPAGLDWRTQPFSHVGGPGSRPIRVVVPGLAA